MRALFLGVLLLVLALPPSARAQQSVGLDALLGPTLLTDEYLDGVARDGDRGYAYGSFGHVGRYGGPVSVLDPATGALDPRLPPLDGAVSDAIPDGQGGAYLGGDFTRVGQTRTGGVLHLLPDGTLDAAFRGAVQGLVYSLALSGGHLYAGGDGVGSGGENLVQLDPATGAAVAAIDGTRAVTELAPAGDTLYAGAGEVLALDAATGARRDGFVSPLDLDVRALAVGDGVLYVGGPGALVALDPQTGVVLPTFRVKPEGSAPGGNGRGTVHVLRLRGGRLFVGGDFLSLSGVPGSLQAIDPVTGRSDLSFAGLRLNFDGDEGDQGVFALSDAGGKLWAGGHFDGADGKGVTGLVGLDPDTGAVADVTPVRTDGPVDALAAVAGELVAGGQSVLSAAVHSNGLAAFDVATGLPDPGFRPPPIGFEELQAAAGRLVAAPRTFDGPPPHGDYHRRDQETVQLLDGRTGKRVRTLAVRGLTGTAIVGRELVLAVRTDDARFPRVQLRRLSLRTGRELGRARIALPGYVRELASVNGKLYAAGSFRRRRADGQPANLAVVRVSPRTGAVDPLFDPHVDAQVTGVAGDRRSIFLVGDFHRAGGLRRNRLAAVASADGVVRPGFTSPFFREVPDELVRLRTSLAAVDFSRPRVRPLSPVTGRRTPGALRLPFGVETVAPGLAGANVTTTARAHETITLGVVRAGPGL